MTDRDAYREEVVEAARAFVHTLTRWHEPSEEHEPWKDLVAAVAKLDVLEKKQEVTNRKEPHHGA